MFVLNYFDHKNLSAWHGVVAEDSVHLATESLFSRPGEAKEYVIVTPLTL